MRKTSFIFVIAFILGIAFNSNSQTPATADYFAGKWEITVLGTPQGDSKLLADLVRNDGKLTGQLVNAADSTSEKIPITAIEENGEKIGLSFTAQGYDVTIDLAKVDDDNLKGTLLNMFEAKAKRLK